jgi:hypothetical protein
MTNKPETTSELLSASEELYDTVVRVEDTETIKQLERRREELKEQAISALESGAFEGDALKEIRRAYVLLDACRYGRELLTFLNDKR